MYVSFDNLIGKIVVLVVVVFVLMVWGGEFGGNDVIVYIEVLVEELILFFEESY